MKIIQSQYRTITPYATKDGSQIREMMHPNVHGNQRQSLAEATIFPGERTLLHQHAITEELYHVTQGCGVMRLGDSTFSVGPGDMIAIPPGAPHNIHNTGSEPMKILCACSPAYSHNDTILLGE